MNSFLFTRQDLEDHDGGGPGPEDNQYGYIPTKWIVFTFLSLFTLSTIIHAGQAIRYRMWWLFPTMVCCGILEIAGWCGRVWAHYNVLSEGAFNLQITTTIIGPTPLLAANFIMFGVIIRQLGSMYSRIGPKKYTIVFLTCDIIALIVQAVGGGLAASAGGEEGGDPDVGGNIMLGGIVFQMAAMVVYTVLATEYFFRYFKDLPHAATKNDTDYFPRQELSGKMKIMLGAMVINTVCLFVRAIYRTIELTDGWEGEIIRTQLWFNVFDGAMVVIALYVFNFIHPGHFLPASRAAHGSKTESSSLESGRAQEPKL